MEQTEEVQQEQDQTAMQAAFAAALSDQELPAETEQIQDEVTPEIEPEATPQAPPITAEQLALLQAIPELQRRLEQQASRADKVDGKYGEIKRMLENAQRAVATPEGAVTEEASEALTYLDQELPEVAAGVDAKVQRAIAKAMTSIPSSANRDEIVEIVQRSVSSLLDPSEESIGFLTRNHPDWEEIRDTAPPDYQEWLSTLRPSSKERYLASRDAYHVAEMLDSFKEWKADRVKTQQRNRQRVEDAVTPTGNRTSRPANKSEDEAAREAFAAVFNET